MNIDDLRARCAARAETAGKCPSPLDVPSPGLILDGANNGYGRIPAHARTCLADLDPHPFQTHAADVLTGWATRYLDGTADRGLLLLGPVGTGKTRLAAATAVTCRAVSGWWHARRLRAEAQAEMNDGHTGRRPLIRRVVDQPLLVLDDLGADRDTDYRTDLIREVIELRYDSGMPLIATTNLRPGDLEELLGDRAYSRLAEMCEPLVVKGADLRRTA